MPQISFPISQAHQAVDEFLTGDDACDHLGNRYSRTLTDPDTGEAVAVIISATEHRTLLDAEHAWDNSQQPKDDPDLPPGYRPYTHSPNATTDRLLPHEPLHAPLAHALYAKPFDDLDANMQARVMGVAIACLLRTTFDPDTQGAVPILALGMGPEAPEARQFWQLGYVTDTPGLFLRVTANGFFGEEWAILTGSGWKLHSGWFSREAAARAAAAIGRVLPYLDWMSAGPDDLTAQSKKALATTVRRYHYTGLREEKPEPDPVTTA